MIQFSYREQNSAVLLHIYFVIGLGLCRFFSVINMDIKYVVSNIQFYIIYGEGVLECNLSYVTVFDLQTCSRSAV
jgi:hypothetical protein